jgi:hypothetical protein
MSSVTTRARGAKVDAPRTDTARQEGPGPARTTETPDGARHDAGRTQMS